MPTPVGILIEGNKMAVTHLYPDGINNAQDKSLFSELQQMDPSKYTIFVEDFADFPFGSYPADSDAVALKYAITLDTELDYDVSYGSGVSDLILTTEGGDTEGGQWRLNSSPFKLTAGKKAWMSSRMMLTATTVARYSLFVGLSTNQTGTNFINDAGTTVAVDNAWGFMKLDASAVLNPYVRASDVAVTASDGKTITTATYFTVGLYYDGTETQYFVDGVKIGTLSGTHPTAAMTLMLHFKSQSAEAGVLNVDNMIIAIEK